MVQVTGHIEYRTVQGDAFDRLALSFYNEERMATYIIQANPDYCPVLVFDAGVVLRIPVLDKVETPETLPPWRRGL